MIQGQLLSDYDLLLEMKQKLKDAQLESQSSPIAILQLPREEIGHLLCLVQKSVVEGNSKIVKHALSKKRKRQSSSERRPERRDRRPEKRQIVAPKNVRPPPPKSYVCRRCNVAGHWLEDCKMKPKNRPPDGYVCHRCNQPGHWISQCPLKSNPRQPPPGYVCHCCGQTDHYIKDCPERQFREGSPPERVVRPQPKVENSFGDFVGPLPTRNDPSPAAGPSTSELDLLEQLLGNDDVSTLFEGPSTGRSYRRSRSYSPRD